MDKEIGVTRIQFLAKLDELFELPKGTISTATNLQELPNWGSLTFLGLIAMVDEELGVTLSPATVLKCREVGDLLEKLAGKLTDLASAA